MRVLDDWIKTVYVAIRYFRVFIRLSVNSASQIGLAPSRHLAQRWGNIVVIRGANLDRIGASVTAPLRQRFRTKGATNPEQRQEKAEASITGKREDAEQKSQISEGLFFSCHLLHSFGLSYAAMLWSPSAACQAF